MKNILFYKYVKLSNLKQFRQEHLNLCRSLNLRGKVLLASEGINGCLLGQQKDIDKYVKLMRKDPRFVDVDFKESASNTIDFKRMLVKIKKEIITSDMDVDVENAAPYIEPHELKELLDKGEHVVLLDARNDYEYKVGKFKDAIDLNIQTFRQYADAVEGIGHLKDKQIVTYCTGGIRCEKASAFLVEKGFTNVKQLHGGLIRYGSECGDSHWEGKCLVFDRRGAIELDPAKQEDEYAQCQVCFIPCEDQYSCLHCGMAFTACEECLIAYDKCCSKFCRNKLKPAVGAKPL